METFVTSNLDKGITIDSITITKLDTVTPLKAAIIELNEITSKIKKQNEIYSLEGNILINQADQYKLYKEINPDDKTTLDISYRHIMNEYEGKS